MVGEVHTWHAGIWHSNPVAPQLTKEENLLPPLNLPANTAPTCLVFSYHKEQGTTTTHSLSPHTCLPSRGCHTHLLLDSPHSQHWTDLLAAFPALPFPLYPPRDPGGSCLLAFLPLPLPACLCPALVRFQRHHRRALPFYSSCRPLGTLTLFCSSRCLPAWTCLALCPCWAHACPSLPCPHPFTLQDLPYLLLPCLCLMPFPCPTPSWFNLPLVWVPFPLGTIPAMHMQESLCPSSCCVCLRFACLYSSLPTAKRKCVMPGEQDNDKQWAGGNLPSCHALSLANTHTFLKHAENNEPPHTQACTFHKEQALPPAAALHFSLQSSSSSSIHLVLPFLPLQDLDLLCFGTLAAYLGLIQHLPPLQPLLLSPLPCDPPAFPAMPHACALLHVQPSHLSPCHVICYLGRTPPLCCAAACHPYTCLQTCILPTFYCPHPMCCAGGIRTLLPLLPVRHALPHETWCPMPYYSPVIFLITCHHAFLPRDYCLCVDYYLS